ncbi:MAG: hypothetical protein COA32_03005 [Fluviicola sp.]|nr:MAG: hypothetical protein COA32_03005 [Fluviicola sp.]
MLKHYDDFELEWGELFRSSGNVEALLKTNDNQYFSLVNKTTVYNFFTDYKKRFYIEPIEAFEPQSRKKVKLIGDGKRTTLEDITTIDNQLVAVSKKNFFWKKETGFYYHFIDPNLLSVESRGFLLGRYNYTGSKNGFGYISLTSDYNKNLAGIFYTIPSEGFDFPRYSFGVLNDHQELLYKNETTFPYRKKKLNFFDEYLTPSGDFFVLAREFTENNNSIWLNEEAQSQIRVFKVEDGELNNFKINQSEFILSEINVVSDENGNLIFSGLYSEDEFSGIHGVFFIKTDSEGEILNKEYHPFSVDFLNLGKSSWAKNRALENDFNGMPVDGLGNFVMHDLRKTSDNGYIGVAEHFEIEKRFSGVGTPGASNRIDTYFFYDDILVYKLDSLGVLDWVKRIPKSQNSINDNGYYLSIVQALTDNHLFLLFNDNSKNYDDLNYYLNLEFPKTANFNFRKNTIAMTKINLEDGSINRFAIGGKNELSTVLVPKLCIENRENNELFLYSRSSNRQRYGSILFKN